VRSRSEARKGCVKGSGVEGKEREKRVLEVLEKRKKK